MQRIEGLVAGSLADISRPQQSSVDRRMQKEVVDAQQLKEAPSGKEVSSDDVRAAAAELKQVVEISTNKQLDFKFEESGKGMFLQIIESGSGKVIKQIPSKEIVELRARIEEIIGMIFDEQA